MINISIHNQLFLFAWQVNKICDMSDETVRTRFRKGSLQVFPLIGIRRQFFLLPFTGEKVQAGGRCFEGVRG
jgi:hypothetical protein